MTKALELLQNGFAAAVAAAQASHTLCHHLPPPAQGRTVVIGFGKAAAAMAQSLEQSALGQQQQPLEGLVVVPYGSTLSTQRIQVIEASHPTPDNNSVLAAQQIQQLVTGLTTKDQVICLISGGGSALLCLPALGLSLEQKQRITQQLLRSGATIQEMNCVRKHLSAIKGGHLAARCSPATVINLIISDVPGDNPADIASGPTTADASSCADALLILRRYHIELEPDLELALESGRWESIKPHDPRLEKVQTHLIATPKMALAAAAKVFEAAGYQPLILGDAIEGEAKEVAKVMAGISKSIIKHGLPMSRPCVLLSGGETTVHVTGTGVGGRNVEFLLALLIALQGEQAVSALAADTDGVDGAAAVAGAFFNGSTMDKAKDLQLRPQDFLLQQDAHTFFQQLDQQIITGPTYTNVNDFRAILIDAV